MMKFVLNKYVIYPAILVFAFILRIVNINNPKSFIMDEIYYIPDAYSILKYGYEVKWADIGDNALRESFINSFLNNAYFLQPENMVYHSGHPPLGKMLIALGMMFFERNDTFGWRISSVVAGVLIVALVMVLAKIIFNNKLITVLSGFLISIDGLAISMSRVGMLDIFLALFVLAGFVFASLGLKTLINRGNVVKVNLFFLMAFLLVGFSTAVKWSGVYFALALFIVYSLFMLIYGSKSFRSFVKLCGYNLIFGLMYLVGYLLSWSVWLVNFGNIGGNGFNAFNFLIIQHKIIFTGLSGINSPHNYSSNAFEWFLQARPTALHYEDLGGSLSTVFTGPNLISWLVSIIALTVFVVLLLRKKTGVIGWVLPVGVLAGWVPWMIYYGRTVFQFYTIVFYPFLIIILAWFVFYIYEQGKKNNSKISKFIVYAIIGLIVLFSLFGYTSAVGIETPSELSGFSYYSRWMNINIELGLYDLNQIPSVEREKIVENMFLQL